MLTDLQNRRMVVVKGGPPRSAMPESDITVRPARRRHARRSTARLIALAASLLAIAAPAASAAPGVVFGIEQNGGMADPVRRAEILDAERDSGAKVIRILLRYDQVATCDGGTSPTDACYDFALPDAVVQGAADRGMTVLLSVYGAPKWKFNGPENYTGGTDAQFRSFVADYADFVQAAATRYDGRHGHPRVTQWTIWNEPNGSFFQPRMVDGVLVGPIRYAYMYDVAARRIKAVDPTQLVAVGPTAPMSPSLTPIKFAEMAIPELQRLGSPVDAWAHNAYMGKQSPWSTTIKSPYVGLGNVDDLVALLKQQPDTANARLWITEFGYQTAVEDRQLMTEEEQALLLTEVVRFAHFHPRIDTFIWYSLFDDEASSGPYGFQSGLYKAASIKCDGKLCPKQSAGTFRHTLWVSPVSAGKVTLWGQGRVTPSATRIFVRDPGKTWRAYASTDTATTGTAQVRVPMVQGMEAVVCDTVCGPVRVVRSSVSGGGGTAKVRKQRLRAVVLGRRTSLARGIVYGVPCAGCRVSATVLAYGRASGIKAAARRQVVVARAAVRSSKTSQRVHLKFTPGARRELGTRRIAKLTIRTTIRYANGTTLIADRPLTLR